MRAGKICLAYDDLGITPRKTRPIVFPRVITVGGVADLGVWIYKKCVPRSQRKMPVRRSVNTLSRRDMMDKKVVPDAHAPAVKALAFFIADVHNVQRNAVQPF